MIIIDLYRNKQGLIKGYKVSGHAGYAKEGQDIICSAVSALTQTPVIGLEQYLKVKLSYNVSEEDGVFEVALSNVPNELTQAVLETMLCGLESIARQCPQYVHIRDTGGESDV